MKKLLNILSLSVLAVTLLAPSAIFADNHKKTDVVLYLLHHNDGESQILNAGEGLEDFGGVSRFATKVRELRRGAFFKQFHPPFKDTATLLISAGDNILSGPEFNASLENGIPFYDGIFYSLLGYDGITIGNHEFDQGPDVLAQFIESFPLSKPPFLSANLDVSAEPALAALEADGRIAPATVVRKGREYFGIIGLTTPNLPFISSPRDVVADSDLVGSVQQIVDLFESYGINKIILSSHLQGIEEDEDLVSQLSGVDIVVAGGGDELLADPGDLLIPGDEDDIAGSYPRIVTDLDGNEVPIVTGPGGYKYVGQLVVGFDKKGNITFIDEDQSGPKRVAGGAEPDAVNPGLLVDYFVTQPVAEFVAELETTIIATSDVILDAERNDVRGDEANSGNLIADAFRTKANELAAQFGITTPTIIAIQNGGGIRGEVDIPAGDISVATTFQLLPFNNFLSVVDDVSAQELKDILENAVSRTVNDGAGNPVRSGGGTGRFAQISGFTFSYDLDAQPEELPGNDEDTDIDGDGIFNESGSRIIDVVIDGVFYVQNGVVNNAAPPVAVATLSFTAAGGDQYPFDGPITNLGLSDQQALQDYLENTLGGVVSGAQYPRDPAPADRRITVISNPNP